MHQNQTDPEYPDKKGDRGDGRDLIQEWLDKRENSHYVWNKTAFDQIEVNKVDRVIGRSKSLSYKFLLCSTPIRAVCVRALAGDMCSVLGQDT